MLLIFLAIWAWPITVACLSLFILYKIIQAIIKNSDKKKRQARIDRAIPQLRQSLQQDRLLLVSAMVGTIKKHWSVLEDKFEQYTDEDDYGNLYVSKGLEKELIYFSQKIVLPELRHKISNGETNSKGLATALQDTMLPPELEGQIDYDEANNKDVAFILQDTLHVLRHIPENYFGIRFDDSDKVIANKLLYGVADNSTIDDELLYTLHTQPSTKETYTNQVEYIFMQDSSITLRFHEKLKTSQPINTSPFVALIFILFSAMYNDKSSHTPKEQHTVKDFIGNDPYKYEEYIKGLLRGRDFSATRTRGSGDFGVDVLASKGGKKFAIQVKLYNRPVGTKVIQEIVSGRIFYKTDFAVVVSDNSFTPAAKTLARKSDVILVHHKNLVHKLESLIPNDKIATVHELVAPVKKPTDQEPTQKKQWTTQDADELITVVLPTIINDGK